MTDNLIMPILSEGNHGSPKSGACFMEFVSFLAGEEWSDAPACADPMLSQIMIRINDRITSDAERSKLAPLIPSVIGTRLRYPSFSTYGVWATEVISKAREAGLLKYRRDFTGRRRSWNTQQLDILMDLTLWRAPNPELSEQKGYPCFTYLNDEQLIQLANIFVQAWELVTEDEERAVVNESRFASTDNFPEAVTVMHELLRTAS